ncbi:hypothetical protein Cgig2_020004 [Carnegiea gigantea]|uniref:Uncharacterized protein n=1 Tax=Carnegiea gigantea TaxID=171969 RepID=A0A9Q1KCH3_9CARY|nr:hypothetical protein Cgig2_020004 [Carnegiea gigantea]
MASVPINVELCERSFEGSVKWPISKDSKTIYDLSRLLYVVLEYLKYWLTQQEIQQVFAKGNNFMFKYLIFCMQLLKSQDQERACMIKNPNTTPIIFKIPKKVTYPITSIDQVIVRTFVKRKVAAVLDYNNFEYQVKINPSYVTLQDVKLPRASMEKMLKMNGREVKQIAQKRLRFSDIDPSLNRLMIPDERILNEDFLIDDEKAWLGQKEKTEAKLINPWAVEHVLDPEEEDDYEYKVISMSKWKMHHHYYVYALVSPWNKVVSRNQFVENDVVQAWSLRIVEEDDVQDPPGAGTLGLVILYAQSATLIKQTCTETPNYDLCVGSKFRPLHPLAKDLQGLATLLVLHLWEKAI